MLVNGLGGACCDVGVGIGVFWEDREMDAGFSNATFMVLSETKISPSSPGEKVRVEQNPSEDVIKRVRPSFDLLFVSIVPGRQ